MMRVAIRTEGGAKVGLGHVRRCLTLASALARLGVQILFVVNADTRVIDSIERAGFEAVGVVEKPGQPQPTLQVLADRRATVLVTDSYAIETAYLAQARERVPVLVVLDDLTDRRLPADIAVNPAIGAERLAYAALTDAQLLLGPTFALLRNEFANVPARSIRPQVERLLVTVGGSDEHNLTGRLVEWARQVLPDAMIDAMIGPFFATIPTLADAKCALHRDPQNVCALMTACDLKDSGEPAR